MSKDVDVLARLEALERRLREVEDERDITRLIASYGPLVDSGSSDEVAALWTEDGVYDVDEVFLDGAESIRKMVLSRNHQGWIAGGCAHFLGPIQVTLDGDDAIAVGHSLMIINTDEGFQVRRATANHWQLRRTAEGWRATVRTTRVLDGRTESPALLAAGALGKLP